MLIKSSPERIAGIKEAVTKLASESNSASSMAAELCGHLEDFADRFLSNVDTKDPMFKGLSDFITEVNELVDRLEAACGSIQSASLKIDEIEKTFFSEKKGL